MNVNFGLFRRSRSPRHGPRASACAARKTLARKRALTRALDDLALIGGEHVAAAE
jgi:hypothetical protein